MKTTKKNNFINSKWVSIVATFITFLFLLLLQLNALGYSLRQKIVIQSTLDFSWFSDLIERGAHGYILGKDFTFTYGPLFQILYSFPTTLFHIPSYISVALAPLISFLILFFLMYIIAKKLTPKLYEQLAFIGYTFLFLGIISANSVDTIRVIIPLVFGLFLIQKAEQRYGILKTLLVSSLPTLAGLYTYNLFITLLIFTILYAGIKIIISKSIKKNLDLVVVICLILTSQLVFSLLLTHNFNYIINSLDSVTNYRYIMNLVWTRDRINNLLLFPIVIGGLYLYLRKNDNKFISSFQLKNINILIGAALTELIYALSRSDAGHLLYALYPSIIVFYTIVFFVGQKAKWLLIVGIFLFVFIPFKPNYSNTFSIKNITQVFQVIRAKPSFFSIYSINGSYYTESEIKTLMKFANKYPNSVYIYPYDSYILNLTDKTYNSFGLGIYSYSNSIVEKNTVKGLSANPPKIIILGIDTKGTLNLDDMANFTRNPQIASWILEHYSVEETTPKNLILTYDKNRDYKNTNYCKGMLLSVKLDQKDTFLERFFAYLKSPVYYYGSQRLPYTPSTGNYLIFPDIGNSASLAKIFEINNNRQMLTTFNDKKELIITRHSPFLDQKSNKTFHSGDFSFGCNNGIKYSI